MPDPADALAAGARTLGLSLDNAMQRRLLDYLALLGKWNATHNLTAIREPDAMVSHHLLDSLAIVPQLGNGPLHMIDVGSGGGLPGIPVAIARPAWHVTLLDSNGKKAAFLGQACAELGIANATALQARAETYRPPRLFDLAVSRAYATLARFVADTAHLVVPGGRLIAMKGTLPRDELRELTAGVVRVTSTMPLAVPGLNAARHLIVMERA